MLQSAPNSTVGTNGDWFLRTSTEKPLNVGAEISKSSVGYSNCTMQGYLHKCDQVYCIIHNSFLECHETPHTSNSTPALKLFLPGSEITKDTDVRHQWAFKLRHPKQGVLQFTAESMEDCKQWMEALATASSIEVKTVRNVEDIRLNDPEMEHQWTTMQEKPSATLPGRRSQAEVQYCQWLGWTWMSPTLVRLHCVRMYICICLFGCMCSTVAALAGKMTAICWHTWYVATSSENLSDYVSSSLAYYAHVTVDSGKPCVCHDKLVNQRFAACSGLPHDDE